MWTSKGVIASLGKQVTTMGNAHDAKVIGRCPRCGAGTNASRVSIREMAVNAVCAAALLAILVPIFSISAQWLERTSQGVLGHMIWREPIERWNQ
jgi:hypothetical protein